MGLRADEQQAMHSIEDGLAISDPKLVSLLATFTRLTAGEALPGRETIPDRRPGESLRWQLIGPLLWLVTSVALISIALAISNGSGGAPYSSCTSACTSPRAASTVPAPDRIMPADVHNGPDRGRVIYRRTI